MKYANEYVADWLLSNKRILSNQVKDYSKLVVDSIMKHYYAFVVTQKIYFEAKINSIELPKISYVIINYISKATRHPSIVVALTLTALYNLVRAGKVPNDWLFPSESKAMEYLKFLESNPNYLTSMLKVLTDTITPTVNQLKSGTSDILDSIKIPLICATVLVLLLKFKK